MKRVVVTLARPGPRQAEKRALYLASVRRPDVAVVPVFPGDEPPATFDALYLSGGEDVAPERYGQTPDGREHVDAERDALEFDLVERALQRRAPILGVCRGFQLLNVALGGSLVQHREGHRSHPPEPGISHEIVIAPQSLLERACGRGPLRVNSWHHQGVRPADLARGARASALVDDLVEALEAPHRGWVVGVQWHPERPSEVDAGATKIFDAFVDAVDVPSDTWSLAARGLH